MKITAYKPQLPHLGLSNIQIIEAIEQYIEDSNFPKGTVRKKLINKEQYYLEKHKAALRTLNETQTAIAESQYKIDELNREVFRKLNILREEIGFDVDS